MRTRDPLHWSALLFGVAALCWALTSVAGAFATLALLTGLAASIVTLIAGLRLTGTARGPTLGGAVLAGLAHVVFFMAFIGANPINFKGDPGRGVNQNPPAAFTWLIDNVGTWIPLILIVSVLVAFWLLWTARERGLGIASLALLVLVLVLTFAGVGDTNDNTGTIYQVLFAAAFIAAAAACALPLTMADEWPDGP